MAGGTFWRDWRSPTLFDKVLQQIRASDSGYINAFATGSYLLTTALLVEATMNSTYINSAIETESFYYFHLRNPQGVLQDGIEAATCAPTGFETELPCNSGLMMEGLAVLSSVTQNATISEQEWQGADGIIAADTGELGGQYIVRGLAAVYSRNTSSDLRNYIEDYIGVQYNAVLNNARTQGSSIYSASWPGPPSSTFSGENQTNALSVLIAAIPLREPDGKSGGERVPTPTNDEPNDATSMVGGEAHGERTLNVGVIAGGVVGGLVAFVTILLGILLRKRQRQLWMPSSDESNSQMSTDHMRPFTL
ncbi:glycoside hydrolase family 76 protein [Moniliophthora roreri MCA 2997]|uniref:Glycoside hydrolase family 76 protein n=2 Tax=Moniliophthora roreri TaxID=221103 RepID=V2X8D9_MONRO|nr:glycoside hydrolase family 76 protein [Moniliophthora roreri MCA 2997]